MQHVILFYRNRFNNAFIPKHYYIQDCAIFPKFVTLNRFHSLVEMYYTTGVTYIKPNISVRQLVFEKNVHLWPKWWHPATSVVHFR